MNSGLFAKSASEIIDKFGIDVILFSNLLPPYLVSKTIPRDLLSVVDLVDHYPTVAAENVPGFIPKGLISFAFSRMMQSMIRKVIRPSGVRTSSRNMQSPWAPKMFIESPTALKNTSS